jgi:hypothetical protein
VTISEKYQFQPVFLIFSIYKLKGPSTKIVTCQLPIATIYIYIYI